MEKSTTNKFFEEHLIKEEVRNWVVYRQYTSKKYNSIFGLILVGGLLIFCLSVFANDKTPLQVCQESYMKATNELMIYNEENPSHKVTLPEYNCNIWTASGAIVPPPERKEIISDKEITKAYMLDPLWLKICKKQVNSPLCKDRKLFDRLYHLTEERLPNKKFYPILIGMTNAESSLWLDFAKDKIGGTCIGRNNWGGAKYMINDDNTREYSRNFNWFDYKYPRDQYDCNLFPFKSIEEYWISKVNGIRYGYKDCIDHETPIWCISWAYVWDRNVREQSWINNVSYFLN